MSFGSRLTFFFGSFHRQSSRRHFPPPASAFITHCNFYLIPQPLLLFPSAHLIPVAGSFITYTSHNAACIDKPSEDCGPFSCFGSP